MEGKIALSWSEIFWEGVKLVAIWGKGTGGILDRRNRDQLEYLRRNEQLIRRGKNCINWKPHETIPCAYRLEVLSFKERSGSESGRGGKKEGEKKKRENRSGTRRSQKVKLRMSNCMLKDSVKKGLKCTKK